MKKLLYGVMLWAVLMVIPVPMMAAININLGISLPPVMEFSAPPDVIVMPDTNDVYLVPDVDEDLFFWNGWWWRLWEGRWYRSSHYNRGWSYYNNVPSFYYNVDPGWRDYYRDRNWYGNRWNYERISHRRLQQNWKSWQKQQHWEKRGAWGIQNYEPRSHRQRDELRQQREEHYQRRPEVQRHRESVGERPHDRPGREPHGTSHGRPGEIIKQDRKTD